MKYIDDTYSFGGGLKRGKEYRVRGLKVDRRDTAVYREQCPTPNNHGPRPTSHGPHPTAHSPQPTAHNTTYSTPYTAHNTQHTAHSTQHTAHNTQHSVSVSLCSYLLRVGGNEVKDLPRRRIGAAQLGQPERIHDIQCEDVRSQQQQQRCGETYHFSQYVNIFRATH